MEINVDVKQPEIATPIELDISTGVSYPILENKPRINGVELIGNKTAQELGLQPQGDYILRGEINIDGSISGDGFATKEELNRKQDKLIAGNNITIVNNVISATGVSGGGEINVDAYTKSETDNLLKGKQDVISDLSTIRNGASLGATAIQPNDLGNATITIKQGGVTKGTFTTNQSNDISINLDAVSGGTSSGGGVVDAYTKAETDDLLSNKADIDLENVVGALSSSVKSYFGRLSELSSTYEELTLGATATTYTAPTNGAYFIDKVATKAGQEVNAYVNGVWGNAITAPTATSRLRLLIKVKKNDDVIINYNLGGDTKYFRFIYAESEVTE